MYIIGVNKRRLAPLAKCLQLVRGCLSRSHLLQQWQFNSWNSWIRLAWSRTKWDSNAIRTVKFHWFLNWIWAWWCAFGGVKLVCELFWICFENSFWFQYKRLDLKLNKHGKKYLLALANAVFWSSLFKARVAIVFWYSSLVYYIPYKLFSVCAAVLECSWSYCEVTATVNLLQTSKNFKSKKRRSLCFNRKGWNTSSLSQRLHRCASSHPWCPLWATRLSYWKHFAPLWWIPF